MTSRGGLAERISRSPFDDNGRAAPRQRLARPDDLARPVIGWESPSWAGKAKRYPAVVARRLCTLGKPHPPWDLCPWET